MNKKFGKIFLISVLVFLILYTFSIFKKKKLDEKITINKTEDVSYNSNIIENVNYISSDGKGNKYTVNAITGEIDYSNSNIIYLTTVEAIIELNNGNKIRVTSDFGKYNIINFNTIFSRNVIINYLDNKVTCEYADFSMERNSLIASRDVIYENVDNTLKADVMEINLETKDTKIFMYKNDKQVKIKSKN
jgi:LPS export ABC transporter protein LptC